MPTHLGPRPVSPDHLQRAFGLGPRRLHRDWLLLVSLAELVAFALPATALLLMAGSPAWVAVTAAVAAAAAGGSALGIAQAAVLGRESLGFSRRGWVLVTTVGASLLWWLGMLADHVRDDWSSWPAPIEAAAAGTTAVLLVVVSGWLQWLVLRRHVPRAGRWVPATVLARLAGLLAFIAITTPLWREGQEPLVGVLLGLAGATVMATATAACSGAFLVRIVHPAGTARVAPAGLSPAGLSQTGLSQTGLSQTDWDRLGSSTDRFEVFDPGLVAGLPEPVQRWLIHAIAPGTSLLTGAELRMHGQVLLGRSWRRFRALQRSSLSEGFVWAARTRLLALPVTGFDRYTARVGEMRWRLLGRLPVMSETGAQISRSCAGRHAAELFAVLPAAALDPSVVWEPVDDKRARAWVSVGEERLRVTVTVSGSGQLRQLVTRRWGAPAGCGYGPYQFGAAFDGEHSFGGYRLPTLVTAGWHFGTDHWGDGQFIRYELIDIRHF